MDLSVLSSFGDFGQEKGSEATSSGENPIFLCKLSCGLWGFFLLSSPGEELFLTFANYLPSCSIKACGRGEKGFGKKKSEKGA